MPTLSSRVFNLEQRTQPQRPHGMTNQELDLHIQRMGPRALQEFVKTMTDDDLNARTEYLKAIEEQQHAKP